MIRAATNLFCLTLVTVATGAFAAQNPNIAKGFNANSVYQFNDIDSINAFNGNLTLSIPIGHPYSIGGGLTYQLRLYANANVWEAEERNDLGDEMFHDCNPAADVIESCMQAYPDRRANAGMGFTLSMGRLFPQHEQTNQSGTWLYESPDGSTHEFGQAFGSVDDGDDTVLYSNDNAYLRLKQTGYQATIEFPTGEVHTFRCANPNEPVSSCEYSPWIIASIGNQFSPNALRITYAELGDVDHTMQMTLSDGFRSHVISFNPYAFESGIVDMYVPNPEELTTRMLVRRVAMAAFGTTEAEYIFEYTPTDLKRPDWHNIPVAYATAYAKVQMLSSVHLPDGNQYAFEYAPPGTTSLECPSGLPCAMYLPTKGKIAWKWGHYSFPSYAGDVAVYNSPAGVKERTLYDRDGVPIGSWTYDQWLDGTLHTEPFAQESKVTITDPAGNKTENYFDVSEWNDPKPPSYGLPLSPKTKDGTGTRYLSQRIVPAGPAAGTRTIYARYETVMVTRPPLSLPFLPKLASRRIEYNDDGNAHLDVDLADYDGLGHYRKQTTSGTGITTGVVTTDYNAARGTYPGTFTIPPVSSPWLLETYGTRAVTEGQKILKTEAYFDPATGFLRRTRVIKDTVTGARGPADVITVYTPDADTGSGDGIIGNVVREEVFGGDVAHLQTAALKDVTLASSDRVTRLDYRYANGTRNLATVYSQANAPMFNTLDADVDARTGRVSRSRDTAGVATDFAYDRMGRLTWAKPTARAWTKYVYPNFSTSNEIIAYEFPPFSGNEPTYIGRSRSVIDGIGRVTKEYVEMPGGAESRRETIVNALGWPVEVSELGNGATLPRTVYTYDGYGRVLTATAPDNSVTSYSYTGIRYKTRTSKISTVSPAAADTSVNTTEESDLLGRLIRVTERSGPTSSTNTYGSSVVTEYGYDPSDRLVTVTMKDGTYLQQRVFDYDGRGFLRWESHPESGITTYTYDGRGGVLSKTLTLGASIFDLQYSYDDAGRLLQVRGRNPSYGAAGEPQFRIMKSFTYGTGNAGADLRNGKLVAATRYNYGDPLYKITHQYAYQDSAGRLTDRATIISQGDGPYEEVLKTVTMSQSYNELDLPVTVTYPMCYDCGAPQVDRDRTSVQRTYDHGRLTSLGRPAAGTQPSQWFIQNATYWPNGMRNRFQHANGITDTQVTDAMARPAQISFGTYDRCVAPTITSQPVNTVRNGSPVTLTVVATGTGPLEYSWYNFTDNVDAGTTQSITVNPTVTTEYNVTVTGACGAVESQIATVSSSCTLPTTGTITVVPQQDGAVILRPDPETSANPTFTWKKQPSNTIVGTQRELRVSGLTETTTYTLTITDSCGTASANVTITVRLPITKTGLVATATSSSSIGVQWPAVTGATGYVLLRRSGAAWQEIARPAVNGYTDTSVSASKTYAYQVYALAANASSNSEASNADVATTRSFTEAVPGNRVSSVPVDDMLAAVNSVRAALGWAPLTWSTIISPNNPLPSTGTAVRAEHILTCRARMNEALLALGVPARPYDEPDLLGNRISAGSINDVQRRAK